MPVLFCLLGCGGQSQKRLDELHLEVVGREYNWYIRYPGNDGALKTADDLVAVQHIHVPAHTPIFIDVTSSDFIYGFRIPELDQKQMAVPDIVFSLAFDSGPPADHTLKGDQMCGFAHESLIGHFVVEPHRRFQTWLKQQRKASSPPSKRGNRLPIENPR